MNIFTVNRNPTKSRLFFTQQQLYQRRLPRTRRPYQGYKLLWPNRETNIVQHLVRSIMFSNFFEFYHRLNHKLQAPNLKQIPISKSQINYISTEPISRF